MYREDNEIKNTSLNTNGIKFMSKLENLILKEEKNITWFKSTMDEILSLEITNDNDDDLKASSLFDYRAHPKHGNVLQPCSTEFSIEEFKLEIELVNKGVSQFESFIVKNCKKYFNVDFLLYHKVDRYVNRHFLAENNFYNFFYLDIDWYMLLIIFLIVLCIFWNFFSHC
jgi:hypothetical protein